MTEGPTPSPEGTPSLGTPAAPPAGTPEETFPRSYVEQLRQENAQARINARDAAESVRTAVLGEVQPKIDAAEAEATRLKAEVGDGWVTLEKIKQAIDAGVPSDKLLSFAAAVQGVDAASIKSSAISLKELFGISTPAPVGATDPTQGSGQRGLANPGQDPLLQALVGVVNKR
jgi:hypothetical protein